MIITETAKKSLFRVWRVIIPIVMITVCCNQQDETSSIAKTKNNVAMVISEDTAMRADPLIFSARMYKLGKGEMVEIIERSREKTWVGKSTNYWYKVKKEKGITGWVYGDNIKIFTGTERKKIDSYLSDFWDEEAEKLKLALTGKWWSVNELGDFTDHCIEIMADGTYKSYFKSGKQITGAYNFNFTDNEIIFLNGTSFKTNLKFIRRGPIYYLVHKSEDEEIKFKKLADTEDY